MRVIIFCVVLTVLAVFIRTAPPTVYMGDSGELAVAGHTLGIGHPPGYPLYTMALKVISLAPAGDIAFRMNLLAVLFSVLTMLMLYFNISFLLEKKAVKKKPAAGNYAAFAVAAAFVFSNVFWFESVIIKGGVYAMECFSVLAVLYCALKYAFEGTKKYLYLGFYLCGFLPAVHNTAMLACVFAVAIMSVLFRREKAGPKATSWMLFLLSFLTSFIYLFIRARSAEIRWSDVGTAAGVFNHLIRLQYSGHDTPPFTLQALLFKLGNYTVEYIKNYNILSLFSIAGILHLHKRNRKLAWVLGLFFLMNLAGIFFITSNNTAQADVYADKGFYLVNDLALLTAAAFGMSWLIKIIKLKHLQTFVAPMFLLVPVIMVFINFDPNNHDRSFLAYDHARNIYKTAGNGDIVFGREDVDVFNMEYMRYVLKKYNGVKTYDVNGNIFDLSYLRGAMGGVEFDRRKQEEFELQTAVNNPETVYYTEVKEFPDKGYFTDAYGILNKMLKGGQRRKNTENLMQIYSIRDVFNTNNMDYMYRLVAGRYLVRRAEYAALGGDAHGFEFWKSGAENLAGDVPNVIKSIALVYFRDLHDLKNCATYLEKSVPLNYYDFGTLNLMIGIYGRMHMYGDALKWAEIYYSREWDTDRKKMILNQIGFIRDEINKDRK